MVRIACTALLSTALTGCAFVLDFDGFEVGAAADGGDAATLDGGAPGDGATTDAPIPDGCVPTEEVCNGEDDDCNGAVDDVDPPPSTAESCGGCGIACASGYACADRHCTNEVSDIAAGVGFTCVRMRMGEVWCFGANDQGQLGRGTTSDHEAEPRQVGTLSGVSRVGAGAMHACAISGGTWCWGFNDKGQLADDTSTRRLAPVETRNGADATAVVAGDAHTCLLKTTQEVWCAGDNEFGQIGSPLTTTDRPRFAMAAGVDNATSLAAGARHNCAVVTGGAVQCWGDNSSGQLGMGVVSSSSVPVAAGLTVEARTVAAGGDHTCALSTAGDVWCWGENGNGELGDGSTRDSDAPVEVGGLPGRATAIAAGTSHTCAIVEAAGGERQVWCWGANGNGQLGNMSRDDSASPVRVGSDAVPVVHATAIGAGGDHTCVAEVDPALGGPVLRCWGQNTSGQLGTGGTTPSNSTLPLRAQLPAP